MANEELTTGSSRRRQRGAYRRNNEAQRKSEQFLSSSGSEEPPLLAIDASQYSFLTINDESSSSSGCDRKVPVLSNRYQTQTINVTKL